MNSHSYLKRVSTAPLIPCLIIRDITYLRLRDQYSVDRNGIVKDEFEVYKIEFICKREGCFTSS